MNEFCIKVEEAARRRLDGRRLRGMNFTWRPIKISAARKNSGPKGNPDSELKVKRPEYSDEQIQAANLLVGADARKFLLQLAQIGKVRATDAKVPASLIEHLTSLKLVSKEYLVVCKKDSHTICQLDSLSPLQQPAGEKLVCPVCGRKFSEELVHEIFASTTTGKELTNSSHWMMIWITELLIKAGLTKDLIVWNASFGEDEIDIMTDELGLRIMFELKDRDFGLGDAYPFAYRLERYKGNVGIVATTERVAEEADKFFQEQLSKSNITIEKLVGDKIEIGIREMVDKHSRSGVLRTLSDSTSQIGINFAPFVQSWMEMFAKAHKSGRYRQAEDCGQSRSERPPAEGDSANQSEGVPEACGMR